MIKSFYKIYSHCLGRTVYLCTLPYSKHPKGCPKHGTKSCSIKLNQIEDILNTNKMMFLIMVSFKIDDYAKIMRFYHPNLSINQSRNLRYWQPVHRKLLREEIKKFKKENPSSIIIDNPENYGVDITETVKKATGIKLNWKYPLNKVWRVAIAGEQR